MQSRITRAYTRCEEFVNLGLFLAIFLAVRYAMKLQAWWGRTSKLDAVCWSFVILALGVHFYLVGLDAPR